MWLIKIALSLLIFILNPIITYIFDDELNIYNVWLFSLTYSMLVYLFTCIERTKNARSTLYCLVIIEFLLTRCLFAQNLFSIDKKFLLKLVWYLRYSFFMITILILIYFYVKYNDANKLINNKLDLIYKQNMYVMHLLYKMQSLMINFQNEMQNYAIEHQEILDEPLKNQKNLLYSQLPKHKRIEFMKSKLNLFSQLNDQAFNKLNKNFSKFDSLVSIKNLPFK